MSSEERRSVENGIWLCQNCAKLIDNDVGRFTVVVLRDWKAKSEARALAALAGGALADAELAAAAEVELIRRNVLINAEQHLYRLEVVATNRAAQPLGDYHVDLEFPRAVVIAPEQHPLYVSNRSSLDIAFFRYAATARKHVIYPGDSAPLITLDYEMNDALFRRQGCFFQLPVVASLYCGGAAPVVVEIPFEQLQCF